MYKNITEYDFVDTIKEVRPDNFSHNGLVALFEYFEEYEDSTGESIEFDPIAICCEFSEYEDLAEIKTNYWDLSGEKDYTLDDLRDHTTVIEFDGGVIVQDF